MEETQQEVQEWLQGSKPQLAIMSRLTVGCFITHCGWNSLLESIAHNVLVMTWSYFADQFLNEWMANEAMPVLDNEAMIVKAMLVLMDGGEEAEERRRKAKEYGEKAHGAMEKGGSSYENLIKLIESFKHGGGKGHWNSVV